MQDSRKRELRFIVDLALCLLAGLLFILFYQRNRCYHEIRMEVPPLTVVDTLSSYETLRLGIEMRGWTECSAFRNIKRTIFPWEDVGENLITYAEQGYRLRVIKDRCPICHRHLHEVYFCSPEWTWEDLCGREGFLIYCPHCRVQWRFHGTKLN